MRKLFLAIAMLVLAVAPARADHLPFHGELFFGFGLQEPFVLEHAPVAALSSPNGGFEVYPTAYTAPNAGQLDVAGGEDGGFVLWPAVFETYGFNMTPPSGTLVAGIVGGVQLSGMNGTGVFQRGANGKLQGQMPFRGLARLCLFSSCEQPIAVLTVTADGVVGVGGRRYIEEEFNVNMTVVGAPWTTGTAAIGTMTSKGGPTPQGGISLVTPVFIRTNLPPIPVIASFWKMLLHPHGEPQPAVEAK